MPNNALTLCAQWTAAAALILVSACVGYKVEEVDYHSPQKPATIVVSDPQVYSRASLINDRRREVEYLQQLLANSAVDSTGQSKVTFSPQIIRDLRTVQALSVNLGLSAGKAVSQAATGASVENQIEVTKLQAQLAILQKQVEGIQMAAAPSVTVPSPDLQSATSLSTTEKQTGEAPLMPDVSALQTSIKDIQSELSSLAKGSGTEPTNNYSGLEDARSDFVDRQAYRRDIRAAIAEAQLDDVHDRAGNALFRLQFQATVLPPNGDSKQWAVTKLRVSPPSLSAADIADAYYRWIGYLTGLLEKGIPADSDQTQQTYIEHSYSADLHIADIGQGGYFNVIDIVRDRSTQQYYCLVHSTASTTQLQQFNNAFSRANDSVLRNYDRLGTFAVPPQLIPLDACVNYPSGGGGYVFGSPLDTAKVVFAVGVTTQFLPSYTRGQLYKQFPSSGPNRPLSFAEPTRIEPDRVTSVPAFFCKAIVDPTSAQSCGAEQLSRFSGTLPAAAGQPSVGSGDPVSETSAVRSYSVLPSELAQRLGVTAESSQSLQTAMTVAAQLSVAAKAGLNLGYLSQMDARAEALTREPIVVGFAGTEPIGACSALVSESNCSGASYFGWLFGPTFEIKDSKTLTLRQTVRSYGVNADISVPGWWNYLILKMSSAWVENWDGRGVLQETNGDHKPLVPLTRRVNLPLSDATYVSLTDFIAARQYGPSDTRLYVYDVTPDVVPACATTVTFKITGVNIWRADTIFFGGAPSSAISVLPDMQGIAATFDMNVVYGSIVNTDSSVQTIPLTVSAAQGSDNPRWITVVGKRQSSSGATACQSPLFLPSLMSEGSTTIVSYLPTEICSDVKGIPLVVQGLNLPDNIIVHSAHFDGSGWTGDNSRRVTDLTLKKGVKLTPGGSVAVAIADAAQTNPKGSFPVSIAVKDCEAASRIAAGSSSSASSSTGAGQKPKAALQTTSVQLAKSQKIALKLAIPADYAAVTVGIRPNTKANNLKWIISTETAVTAGSPGIVTGTFDLSAIKASVGDKFDVEVMVQGNPQLEPTIIAADKELAIARGPVVSSESASASAPAAAATAPAPGNKVRK